MTASPRSGLVRSVLVANRGEIAVRVLRTCRRLGIRTIAVYSDADASAVHVAHADGAYRIGPGPASESYLDGSSILRVARDSGAEAVHPGYGFLSENPAFAEECLASGLVWIGPSPEAMRRLGDKAAAKALAQQAGVPILPGYHGANQDPALLARHAEAVGFPLLVKASAGGGGRGMRVVEAAGDLAESIEAAQREALAAFGDARVLLERYVRRPRHVEVQLLGDSHGHLVHLGERECSIQRRHQKLVEESPSPAVDANLRARMGEAALTLARAAAYTSAGTVEFLLEESGAFWFLEVNARLQVEHPVTEAVTNLDLVEQQIRIASGEPLAFDQAAVPLNGHALEVRLVAEDPAAGFLPSTGRLNRFHVPDDEPGLRVDTGYAAGSEVSPYYDSLLAKVVAHGQTRGQSIERLREALAWTNVRGVSTNLDLLRAILAEPDFVAGRLHTGFLDDHDLIAGHAALPSEVLAAVAARPFLASPPARHADPWRAAVPWRPARLNQPSIWLHHGKRYEARVDENPATGAIIVSIGGVAFPCAAAGGTAVRVGDELVSVEVTAHGDLVATRRGRTYAPSPFDLEAYVAGRPVHAAGGDAASGSLTAPMPGRVVKIHVREGDPVEASQTLLVLEAMKMEHLVSAPHDGHVAALHVRVGDQVASGAPLLEVQEGPP